MRLVGALAQDSAENSAEDTWNTFFLANKSFGYGNNIYHDNIGQDRARP